MSGPPLGGILACPLCGDPLEVPDPDASSSAAAVGAMAGATGFLDLTPVPPPPGRVADCWELWERLQANGAAAYEAVR